MDKVNYTVGDLLRERDIMFLEDKLSEYDFSMDTRLDEKNAEFFSNMIIDNIDDIEENYSKDRRYISKYLKEIVKESRRLAIVDIGWFGSGPDALRRAFEQEFGDEVEVHCVLAGSVQSPLIQKRICHPYLFAFNYNRNNYDSHHGPHQPQRAYVAFEMFNSSTTPSFSGIRAKDENYDFMYSVPFVEGYEDIREIQKGILDFCKTYMEFAKKYPCLKDISGYDAYLPFRVALRNFDYWRTVFHDFPVEPEVGNNMEPLRLCEYI